MLSEQSWNTVTGICNSYSECALMYFTQQTEKQTAKTTTIVVDVYSSWCLFFPLIFCFFSGLLFYALDVLFDVLFLRRLWCFSRRITQQTSEEKDYPVILCPESLPEYLACCFCCTNAKPCGEDILQSFNSLNIRFLVLQDLSWTSRTENRIYIEYRHMRFESWNGKGFEWEAECIITCH